MINITEWCLSIMNIFYFWYFQHILLQILMYLYLSKILNAVLVMKHFSIVVRQVSKRSSSITAYNRRELTSSTLQYKNNVVSLFPCLHESSTGEDANFLPRTCNFSFNLLAQYHAGSHQVGIFKTLFLQDSPFKNIKKSACNRGWGLANGQLAELEIFIAL